MKELKELARAEWVSACRFVELTEREVLAEVAKRVRDVKAKALSAGAPKSAHPLVLLDLDSTLYEVQPRSERILKEWTAAPESAVFSLVRDRLRKLEPRHLGFSLKDTFISLGLSFEDPEVVRAWESAKGFWSGRFFSSEYLQYDRVYPGAAEFTRHLFDEGAEIAYLTGRDDPGMGAGTRTRLKQDGFPCDPSRTHFLLKASTGESDLDHKRDSAEYLRRHGTLIASFENEPMNLVMLYGIFPEAMHVFADTVYSDRPAMPREGLYRIQGFSGHLG